MKLKVLAFDAAVIKFPTAIGGLPDNTFEIRQSSQYKMGPGR